MRNSGMPSSISIIMKGIRNAPAEEGRRLSLTEINNSYDSNNKINHIKKKLPKLHFTEIKIKYIAKLIIITSFPATTLSAFYKLFLQVVAKIIAPFCLHIIIISNRNVKKNYKIQ